MKLDDAKSIKAGTTNIIRVMTSNVEVWPKTPMAPANFRATNVGATWNSISFAWDAVSNATAYKIYYRINAAGNWVYHSQYTGLSAAIGLGADTNHEFVVTTVRDSYESAVSNSSRIRSGHPKQSIPGGSGGIQSSVVSHNKWRQNQWGYNGTQPYWGWYDTQAYRYHGFVEIPDWHIRQLIVNNWPQLNGHWGSIGCVDFSVGLRRASGVGNWSNAINPFHWYLANGISYANPNEPGMPGNVANIPINGYNTPWMWYGVPANWGAAIYQQHSSYNGLMWYAYRNDGARQPYGSVELSVQYAMTLSWGEIVTVSQVNTSYW